jgi:hypothetical protein
LVCSIKPPGGKSGRDGEASTFLAEGEAAQQADHAAQPFSATLVRFRGGTWRVVLTPEQWAAYVGWILREGLL